MKNNKPVRISQFLSQSGICSRRKGIFFLSDNEVYFKGKLITDISFKIPTQHLSEPIIINGKKYYWQQSEIILLNKPKGYICSHREYKNYKSIFRFLSYSKRHYFFAGRLDVSSRGLMVLSNNGDYIYKLTHPSFRIKRVYHVILGRYLTQKETHLLLKGIYNQDEYLKLQEIHCIKKGKSPVYKIILYQGRKREIRRLMQEVRCKVLDIQRISFGEHHIFGIPEGSIKTVIPHQN